jgi:hypothetical protein
MRRYIRNDLHLNLLAEINRHDRLGGSIGILPNSLMKFVKTTRYQHREAIFQELKMTVFWSGYQLWKERIRLKRVYWREKVPISWNPKGKRTEKNKKAKA